MNSNFTTKAKFIKKTLAVTLALVINIVLILRKKSVYKTPQVASTVF